MASLFLIAERDSCRAIMNWPLPICRCVWDMGFAAFRGASSVRVWKRTLWSSLMPPPALLGRPMRKTQVFPKLLVSPRLVQRNYAQGD